MHGVHELTRYLSADPKSCRPDNEDAGIQFSASYTVARGRADTSRRYDSVATLKSIRRRTSNHVRITKDGRDVVKTNGAVAF